MQPSPHNIVSALRQSYPDIYSSIMDSYRRPQYDLSVIDKLYAGLPGANERNYFFGCVVLLFRRFEKPKIKDHILHYGISDYLCRVTGLHFSNITIYVQRVHFLLSKLKGFREECELLLSKIIPENNKNIQSDER